MNDLLQEGEELLETYNLEYIRVVVDLLKDAIEEEFEITGDTQSLIEKYTVYFENREIHEKGLEILDKYSIYDKSIKRFVLDTMPLVELICSNDISSETE